MRLSVTTLLKRSHLAMWNDAIVFQDSWDHPWVEGWIYLLNSWIGSVMSKKKLALRMELVQNR